MSDIVNVRSTIAANGGVVVIRTGGMPVVGIELEGTWVGTLHLQETVSGDGFVDAQATNAANTPVSAIITANGKFFVAAAGRSAIQVIATAWTSGTATVVGVPTLGSAGGSSGGGGGAVTVADGANVAQGTTTDAGIIADVAGSSIGFLRGAIKMWITFLSRLPAALVGGRLDVNVGATGVTQPISAASLPLPTGAAADASLTALNTSVGNVLTTADFDTKAGSLTETAPATDTASSGLNGRLQRVAQRLTALIALLPTALISNRLDVNLGAAPAAVTIGTNAALVAGSATIGAVNQGTQNGAGAASWPVQGAAAAGAAVAGNPVATGLSDTSNAQYWRQVPAASTAIVNGLGVGAVGLHLNNGGANWFPAVNAGAQGDNNAANGSLAVFPSAWNGGGADRIRNNVDVTLLASAARTTTQTGSNITAYNCQAIAVTLDVTATVSTVSLTVTIGYVDPASGKVINLLTSAVIAAAGTTMLLVDPRVVAAANLVAMKPIGRVFVITVTVGNANSQTYSVGYTLIPC